MNRKEMAICASSGADNDDEGILLRLPSRAAPPLRRVRRGRLRERDPAASLLPVLLDVRRSDARPRRPTGRDEPRSQRDPRLAPLDRRRRRTGRQSRPPHDRLRRPLGRAARRPLDAVRGLGAAPLILHVVCVRTPPPTNRVLRPRRRRRRRPLPTQRTKPRPGLAEGPRDERLPLDRGSRSRFGR